MTRGEVMAVLAYIMLALLFVPWECGQRKLIVVHSIRKVCSSVLKSGWDIDPREKKKVYSRQV